MKLEKRHPEAFGMLVRILDLHGKVQGGWTANPDGTWSGCTEGQRRAMAEEMVALRRRLRRAIASIPQDELEQLDDYGHLKRQTAEADRTADEVLDELARSKARARRR